MATGAVERVEKTRLDVTTAEGRTATFVLSAETVVFRGDVASTTATVKAGERVAVDFEEAAGVKKALRIRVGEPSQAMRYTCPMHPEVVSDKPGKCPKCGMYLTPAEASKP